MRGGEGEDAQHERGHQDTFKGFLRSGNVYGEFSDPERQFMVSKDVLNPQPVEDLKCQDHVRHGEKTELATNPSQYSMIRQAPLPACAMRSTAPCAAKRLSPQVFPPSRPVSPTVFFAWFPLHGPLRTPIVCPPHPPPAKRPSWITRRWPPSPFRSTPSRSNPCAIRGMTSIRPLWPVFLRRCASQWTHRKTFQHHPNLSEAATCLEGVRPRAPDGTTEEMQDAILSWLSANAPWSQSPHSFHPPALCTHQPRMPNPPP